MPYRDPQVLSHFEEMDRQSKAHHAAMNRKLGGGTFFPPIECAKRVERWGRRLMPWVFVASALFILWALRWALN